MLALLISTTSLSFGQGPGGIDPGDENPDNPGVPLDGGVSLLIAGGVSYVAIKMRKQQLKRKAAVKDLVNK